MNFLVFDHACDLFDGRIEIVFYLFVEYPKDFPAVRDEQVLAFTVFLKRAFAAMILKAVELDDQARCGNDDVSTETSPRNQPRDFRLHGIRPQTGAQGFEQHGLRPASGLTDTMDLVLYPYVCINAQSFCLMRHSGKPCLRLRCADAVWQVLERDFSVMIHVCTVMFS